MTLRAALRHALLLALVAPATSLAVSLANNGLGQALIYPYYTVQSSGGSAFNTYVSLSNHGNEQKALRVRFREGRLGKETLSFNLFLARGDMWTGALVPTADGARLITRDASCTDPPFTVGGDGVAHIDLRNAAFTGNNGDTAGEGLDRVREGYVEVIEMATLTGPSGLITPGPTQDCAAVRANSQPDTSAPRGGLGGTLTLLNVATGMVFTLSPHALADLASRAYFRPASNPYPDFNAAEIDAVSHVVHEGAVYRSLWTRPEDAVSAVLMGVQLASDFVLDRGTASQTDLVAVLPTRRLYGNGLPFMQRVNWSQDCARDGTNGEYLSISWLDREARGTTYNAQCGDFGCIPLTPPNTICAAAGVVSIRRAASAGALPPSDVLGSRTLGLAKGEIVLPGTAENGRLALFPSSTVAAATGFESLPASTRINLATGEVRTGIHRHYGLPMIGAGFYTFRNGTLQCGTQLCQGNFGNAFPMRSQRYVELWPGG